MVQNDLASSLWRLKIKAGVLLAILAGSAATGASASALINGSFETGLTGWTTSVPMDAFAGTVPGWGPGFSNLGFDLPPPPSAYTPKDGASVGLLKGDSPTLFTTVSQTFTAAAGDKISGWAFFDTGEPVFDDPAAVFNDNAQVRILSATGPVTAFSADVLTVGNEGQTPWTYWEFTVPVSGTYTVQGRIRNAIDSSLDSVLGLDAITLTTGNTAPTADAGGPYAVAEGGSVQLSGSGTDPDGDPLTYAWDLDGDGTFETSGQTPTFPAVGLDGPTSRTVTLKVTDDNDVFDTATAEVSIHNAPPALAEVSSSKVNPLINESVSINGSFTDGGVGDGPWTLVVNWGDGSVSAPTEVGVQGTDAGDFHISHAFSSPGTYTVQIMVTDKEGDSGTTSLQIKVSFKIVALFDQTKAHKRGSTIPIRLQLSDANGNNLSSAANPVHAVDVSLVSAVANGVLVEDSGNANPDSDFCFDAGLGGTGGYIFNLSSKGLGTGTYRLNFSVQGDPVLHSVQFQVK